MPAARPLVFGGGLVGGHVACALARAGCRPVVVSRSFNPYLTQAVEAGADVELKKLEITLGGDLLELIDDADRLFFLAGASTPTHAARNTTSSAMDSVLTVLTALDLMRQTSTRRIVIASSGGTIYGEPLELPTPESHRLEPISMHGLNSLVVERYARFFAEHHDLGVSVLRYSNVYGPGQTGRRGQGVIAAWLRAVHAGEPISVYGPLEARRDFVFAEDAAKATLQAGLDDELVGVYNVGSGVGVALADVVDVVCQVTGEDPVVHQHPPRGLDVSVTALDCSKLRRASGWMPTTSLSEGVRRSWTWMSDHADQPVATADRPWPST